MQTAQFKNNLSEVEIADTLSPFGAAKIAEQVLERRVRPQMIYNYCGKGYIAASRVDGSWQIERDEFVAWLTRFAIRNVLDIEL